MSSSSSFDLGHLKRCVRRVLTLHSHGHISNLPQSLSLVPEIQVTDDAPLSQRSESTELATAAEDAEIAEELVRALLDALSFGLVNGLGVWHVAMNCDNVPTAPQETLDAPARAVRHIRSQLPSASTKAKSLAFIRCLLNEHCLLAAVEKLSELTEAMTYCYDNRALLRRRGDAFYDEFLSCVAPIGGPPLMAAELPPLDQLRLNDAQMQFRLSLTLPQDDKRLHDTPFVARQRSQTSVMARRQVGGGSSNSPHHREENDLLDDNSRMMNNNDDKASRDGSMVSGSHHSHRHSHRHHSHSHRRRGLTMTNNSVIANIPRQPAVTEPSSTAGSPQPLVLPTSSPAAVAKYSLERRVEELYRPVAAASPLADIGYSMPSLAVVKAPGISSHTLREAERTRDKIAELQAQSCRMWKFVEEEDEDGGGNKSMGKMLRMANDETSDAIDRLLHAYRTRLTAKLRWMMLRAEAAETNQMASHDADARRSLLSAPLSVQKSDGP